MKIRLALCAVVLVGWVGTLSAQTVMVTNLGGALVGSSTVDSSDWWAGSFTTDNSAASFALDSITLKINSVDNASGNFFVTIYSNAGSLPGAQVGSLLSGASSPAAGDNTYTASGITLAANSTYWLVAGVSSGPGGYEWEFSNNPVTTAWTINAFDAKSTNGGVGWAGPFTSPLMFSVTATAIPEPSTAALLLGMCTVGVAWVSRRRTAR